MKNITIKCKQLFYLEFSNFANLWKYFLNSQISVKFGNYMKDTNSANLNPLGTRKGLKRNRQKAKQVVQDNLTIDFNDEAFVSYWEQNKLDKQLENEHTEINDKRFKDINPTDLKLDIQLVGKRSKSVPSSDRKADRILDGSIAENEHKITVTKS